MVMKLQNKIEEEEEERGARLEEALCTCIENLERDRQSNTLREL